MSAGLLQTAALCAAFWTAVLLFDRRAPAADQVRFVVGLGLGAVFAHLGWALLHGSAVWDHPWSLLDPTAGYCVLFVPLGMLVATRQAAAFACLPLALAVARLGCLVAGCCHGANGELTPLAEIAGLVALHTGVRRLPERWVAPAVLAGFGLVRLAVGPWRAPPALGEPAFPAAAIAALWIAVAAYWGLLPKLRPVFAARTEVGGIRAARACGRAGEVTRWRPPGPSSAC